MLLGYLLTAPGYLLAPLAVLLALSRPSSLREWLWLGAALFAVGWLVWPVDSLAVGVTQAATVLIAGYFAAATLRRPDASVFGRGVVAAAATAVSIAVWFVAFHLTWADLLRSDTALIQEQLRRFTEAAPNAFTAEEARQAVATWAPLYPALELLGALGGLAVAWAWYHRLATWPIGRPLGRLRDFRFGDQAIWLLVGSLALVLAPAPPTLRQAGQNLLLLVTVMYALRGVAVFATSAERAPRLLVAVLGVLSFVLFPVAAGGLTLLGVADTWLDFRRRLASPTGGVDR